MLDDALVVATLLAALGCGLVGGIFFAFSVFIMRALERLPPAHGAAAMQSINITVLTGWFLAPFFGTGLLCLALAIAGLTAWGEPEALYLLVGGLLYPVGTLGVTMACNVPRNNALAAVAPDSPEGTSVWAQYLPAWTNWNTVRTVTALASAVLFSIALVVR
jgi:uncharacterized membrane protein